MILPLDGYAKDGGPGEVYLHVVFTMSLCVLELKYNDNKFAIWSHTALKLRIQPMKRYLKLTYKYEPHNLP